MEPPSAHVTPTEEMINLFDSWDTTKLKNRLRSFNRAKSWFCKVLKCPFPELPEKHNMRQKDNENALELLLEAYSSGLPFEDYIKRGLQGTIIVKTESESNAASSDDEGNDSKDDSFCDAPEIITEETRVAVATKHCEPDCSQCRVAAETITFTRVASATGGAAVTGETVAAEVPKRPPVCHFLWLAEVCTEEGCQKSHPPLCNTLSSCLELDQNLPRWKSTGCKKWHGRTKSLSPKPRKAKKSNGKPRKVSNQKSRTFHGSRPQTMGLPWPQSQPQPPAQAWLQNLDQPTPHSPLEIDQWNQLRQMGNGQAAQTPLSGSGNNQWGNGMMPYNMAVKGPNPATLQFELEILALMSRVLA
jgi:hypothetical protein